jgi:Icc-related predicted phosphoesterase
MPADTHASNGDRPSSAHGAASRPAPPPVRIAATGDIHCTQRDRARIADAFAKVAPEADLIVIAGDVTTHGEAAEAEVLAEACRPLDVPVIAVLGNHDWHAGRQQEIAAALGAGGIEVLDRSSATRPLDQGEVGIVGTKGFIGGFPGSHLTDFGEPALRQAYAETSAEVAALDAGLREVANCPYRLVVLHYSPVAATLDGEPPGIWTFLGSDRLAAPILEHEPDLVVHGHAHAGTFEGRIGEVPVYNVSVPVMERDFWVFELAGQRQPTSPIH